MLLLGLDFVSTKPAYMIKKVLVANRGEIAVRIMRSCRELNIRTVAVFSDADRKSMHVCYADEAVHIGASPSSESYLNVDNIIRAAKATDVDAIHPGYGFLSENAMFSDRCQKEGFIFIGPTPSAISKMGDKISAREMMVKAGVPVVPGTHEDISTDNEAVRIIEEIGLPVIIKASAGGGGKGMRLVKNKKDITSSLRSARSEAEVAFGNDLVYVEKYIDSPHHIEFQILADTHGNVIHLFERECSVQRRHQKIIEETPSPILTPEKREEMGKHAIEAAKAVNYVGAGTIEFIVDEQLNYYFLEMNTRLQVEHPITERVVGVDLVKEQIDIANGNELSLKQEELYQSGHSIECRVYAEDPQNNFMPAPGRVVHITEPRGNGVRVDGYVYKGFEIPIFYDPLIAKVISWGKDRTEAISRLKRALRESRIIGVKNSLPFLRRIVDTPDFINGNYNTHFIDKNKKYLMGKAPVDKTAEDMVMIAALLEYLEKIEESSPKELKYIRNNWKDYTRVKNVMKI